MGLKSLLFGGGKSKEERQIEKLKNKLMNPHRQTDERMWVMQSLAEIGSEQAVEVLLNRFTFQTDSSMVDANEKERCHEYLIEMGAVACEPLRKYVIGKKNMYWPLSAYRAIRGDEDAETLLVEAINSLDHGYAEEERRKTELFSNLREFQTDRTYEMLKEALKDTNDDVRVIAVEGLISFGPKMALAPLIETVVNPEESARIRTVIMEVLADTGWSLMKYRARLMGNLMPAYDIAGDGKIIRN
jgi:HEAT repeat protein